MHCVWQIQPRAPFLIWRCDARRCTCVRSFYPRLTSSEPLHCETTLPPECRFMTVSHHNEARERSTRSFKAAPLLNVTLCDTSGQKQMESAHCGASVVLCSYDWGGGKLGETNTSVVPVCYIKLLLSQTQQKTGWTGATGYQIFSLDHQRSKTECWRFLEASFHQHEAFIQCTSICTFV